MKKYLVIALTLATLLSAAGCSSNSEKEPAADTKQTVSVETEAKADTEAVDTETKTETAEKDTAKAEDESENENSVEDVFSPEVSDETGTCVTIKVSADVKMDDDTAWVGLCPAGKDYVTEIEADDADVVWFYAENEREEGDPYVFVCDFSSVEDGKYALVVNTSDDENVGYVAIQLEMTKKADKLDFDFDNAKLNERPAK